MAYLHDYFAENDGNQSIDNGKLGRILCKGKGGGGSSGPTQTNVQNTNIPEYARPYVETMLGTAQQQVYDIDTEGNVTGFKPFVPYSENPADYIAGFSPMQNQAFQQAQNLQVPGQFAPATGMAAMGGIGSLGAGQQYNQMATNPYATQAFMNPYISASLAPQLQEIGRQYSITGTQQQGQATQAGAFGGTREALMASENQRNKNMAMNQAIASGYDKAFQAAQQAQQFGANLGLQGYGQGIQAAGQLGQLGTSQLAAQQGVIGTQSQLGAQQQERQQNIINQAIQNYATQQQYPMQQLGNMSNLLRGLPMQSTTTQSYQAAPSALTQAAGLGTGIAGVAQLMKAEGGVVKSYAGGGITSLANRERLAEKLAPKQLDQVIRNKTIPEEMGRNIKDDKINQQARAIIAMNQEPQGIDDAESNLPEGYAQGGIIAFAQGDKVVAPKFDWTPKELDVSTARQLYEEAMNPATGKRYSEEEIIAKQRAKEAGLGIKDIYTGQLEELQKEKAGLEGQKDRALGLSLLSASGKMLGSTSPFAFAGIGEGLGEFSTKYGSALDKIDANKLAMRKEENSILAAQQQMKQAQMAGDTVAYKAAEDKYTSAINNYSNAQNENVKLANAAGLEGKKAEYEYGTKRDIALIEKEAKIAAAKAGQSPFTGETNARVSLSTRAELINKAMDDLNAEYKTSMSGWLGQDPATLKGATKNKYDEYNRKKNAIINSVRSQFDPIIKDQLTKLGKSEQEINAMINAINVESVAGNTGGGGGSVMKFDANGNPVK